jgi:hypothetical protein
MAAAGCSGVMPAGQISLPLFTWARSGRAGHQVALLAIMQAGGWRTPEMVGRYTRRLDARNTGAAELARKQGRA